MQRPDHYLKRLDELRQQKPIPAAEDTAPAVPTITPWEEPETSSGDAAQAPDFQRPLPQLELPQVPHPEPSTSKPDSNSKEPQSAGGGQ